MIVLCMRSRSRRRMRSELREGGEIGVRFGAGMNGWVLIFEIEFGKRVKEKVLASFRYRISDTED